MLSFKNLCVLLDVACNSDYWVPRKTNWVKSWSTQFVFDERLILPWPGAQGRWNNCIQGHCILSLKLPDTSRSLNDSLPVLIFPFSLLCGLSWLCSHAHGNRLNLRKVFLFVGFGLVWFFFFHILPFSLKAFSSCSWFPWVTWRRQWCVLNKSHHISILSFLKLLPPARGKNTDFQLLLKDYQLPCGVSV